MNECRLAADQKDDNLFATDVTIEPRKVSLALEGSGFVIKNGHARPTLKALAHWIARAIRAGLVAAR